MKIKSPKDFWSGVMFIGLGLFFMLWAMTHYQMGSAVLIPAFTVAGEPVPKFHFRPLLFISIGCVLYGYLMKPLGLVGATAALVYVSAYGGHEFKWKEVTILFVILIVFSILVFVKGL